jgi:hypothetical protein
MKNFTLITALLTTMVFTTRTHAQNTYESRFSIGPAFGTGHAWTRNTAWLPVTNQRQSYSNLDPAYKPSWSVGVSTVFRATQHFGIGMDLLYSMEGDRSMILAPSVYEQLDLQYFRVPLRFMYFFGNSSNSFRPQVSLGATAGWKTGSHGMFVVPGREVEIDVKNWHKSYDYGINASVGFNQKIAGRISVNVDIVYYHGLNDIISGDDDIYDQSTLNTNIGLKLGVLYGL